MYLNSIRAGIVEKVQDYIHSSANNYVNGQGLIEIELSDNPVVNITKANELIVLSKVRRLCVACYIQSNFTNNYLIKKITKRGN